MIVYFLLIKVNWPLPRLKCRVRKNDLWDWKREHRPRQKSEPVILVFKQFHHAKSVMAYSGLLSLTSDAAAVITKPYYPSAITKWLLVKTSLHCVHEVLKCHVKCSYNGWYNVRSSLKSNSAPYINHEYIKPTDSAAEILWK